MTAIPSIYGTGAGAAPYSFSSSRREKQTMAQPHSIRPTDAATVPPELQELAAAIQSLPEPYRVQIEPVLQRVIDGTRRRRQILSLVQDALSELRMDMKYLLFDLEATRRERDDYRRQLEQLRQGE